MIVGGWERFLAACWHLCGVLLFISVPADQCGIDQSTSTCNTSGHCFILILDNAQGRHCYCLLSVACPFYSVQWTTNGASVSNCQVPRIGNSGWPVAIRLTALCWRDGTRTATRRTMRATKARCPVYCPLYFCTRQRFHSTGGLIETLSLSQHSACSPKLYHSIRLIPDNVHHPTPRTHLP
jgi:hypothetical protein